jgi:hypothetical protein
VKFYASDLSDHRKVGCKACHASDVYHPDDTTTNLFDERVPGRLAHVRLQKAWADEQGIFMVMHGEGSGYRCIVKGCDNRDVQAHHYAHKAALGQRAEAFGTVPLCREHHDELHNGVRLHIARGGQL